MTEPVEGRQRQILEFLRTHARQHSYPPTVREIGHAVGLSLSSTVQNHLNALETKGLIRSLRTRGNQRRYPRSVLRRIAIIKVAQKAGISLSTILQALASLPEHRAPTLNDWRKLSTGWRMELDSRIRKLVELRDRLDDCIGCGCLSVTACPLRNPSDKLARQGAGPRPRSRRHRHRDHHRVDRARL